MQRHMISWYTRSTCAGECSPGRSGPGRVQAPRAKAGHRLHRTAAGQGCRHACGQRHEHRCPAQEAGPAGDKAADLWLQHREPAGQWPRKSRRVTNPREPAVRDAPRAAKMSPKARENGCSVTSRTSSLCRATGGRSGRHAQDRWPPSLPTSSADERTIVSAVLRPAICAATTSFAQPAPH
jgi:hypothetical protein